MELVAYAVSVWCLWWSTVDATGPSERPNIVIIVADDLGWNDVSFHGSNQIPTPNIDALAYDGIILNRHYVPPLCTPSRASLMTGRHPMSIGMQDHVILSDEPWGVGLDQKLMPQYFREAGYRTHLVGKWHLGFFRRAYTPTFRGFDSHFGYLGPYIDYWDHSLQMNETSARGLDMRRNTDVNYSANGTYATDLFNDEAVRLVEAHDKKQPLLLVLTHLAPHTGNEDDPMQAPSDEIEKFNHIKDPRRRILAAMISRIDTGVGKIYRALEKRSMLENSIILFYADNGAPTVGVHANSGSNYPLRGQKESPWEGGVRGAALIWSPLLTRKGAVSEQWIHVSDWLPTLAYAAGINIPPRGTAIDGQNQWKTLQSSSAQGRSVVMNNAHAQFTYSSYIKRDWKYVNGSSMAGQYDGWLGLLDEAGSPTAAEYYRRLTSPASIGSSLNLTRDRVKEIRNSARVDCGNDVPQHPCEPLVSPCLFNIVDDPCERRNLATQHPDVLRALEADVQHYRARGAASRQQPSDGRANPALHNFTWTWWLDESTVKPNPNGPGASFIATLQALGAVRGAALIWSPLLPRKGVVSEQWIHVSDWLPTLGFAAGITGAIPPGSAIDGQNQWNTLLSASSSGRTVVMNNADERFSYSSYTKNGWKYVNGSCFRGAFDGWLGQLSVDDELSPDQYFRLLTVPGTIGATIGLPRDRVETLRSSSTIRCPVGLREEVCEPLRRPCLFNLLQDPCERRNLANEYPDILADLQADVWQYRLRGVRPRNQPPDGRSDPALYNFTWTWWQDEVDSQVSTHYFLMFVAAVEIVLIVLVICLSKRFCTAPAKGDSPKHVK